MSRRLCSRAPTTVSIRLRSTGRRLRGTGDLPSTGQERAGDRLRRRPPDPRPCPTPPPCRRVRRPPGPMSTTQSAVRMVSSSCSTTISVLPRSRSRVRVWISRWLSRWCSPIDGSSSTYSTPTSPEPICVASRIRCASPPDSVAAARFERQVVESDVEQEAEPGVDLLEHPFGDHPVPLGQHQPGEELTGLLDRQGRDLGDVQRSALGVLDRDGQDLRLEPRALADGTRHLPHVALVLLPRQFGVRLRRAPLQERDDALEVGVVRPLPAVPVAVADVHLMVGAVQDGLAGRAPTASPTGCRWRSPYSSASPCSSRVKYSPVVPCAQGWIAPSASERSSSGTTSSGSTSLRVPRPVHSGQAPNGELNENDRGSSSSRASGWSFGQASRSE